VGCEAIQPSVKSNFWGEKKTTIGIGYIEPAKDCRVRTDDGRACFSTGMLRQVDAPGPRSPSYRVWEEDVQSRYEKQYGDVDKYINTIDRHSPLVNMQHEFATRLSSLGYSVKEISAPVRGHSVTEHGALDFTAVAQQEHVNVLLVLGESLMGVSNHKSGCDHWSAANCFWGFMNSMQHGQLRMNTFSGGLWKLWTPHEVCYIPLAQGWDESSNYEVDKQVLDQAYQQSKKYLLENFFKTEAKN
jgi:hypothetical protein